MPSPTSTSSSLSSSERFGLNEKNRNRILVYNRKDGKSDFSSEQDLCKLLDNDRSLRCSRLPIPWGNSTIEVHHGDLFPADQRTRFAHKPSMKLSLSAIQLPRSVYWKRLLGQFRDLYIVSPEGSPSSSPENSQWLASRRATTAEGQARQSEEAAKREGGAV